MDWSGKGNAERSVKIFISMAVSNAMNLQEESQVLSLHKAMPPGLYARSHSAE